MSEQDLEKRVARLEKICAQLALSLAEVTEVLISLPHFQGIPEDLQELRSKLEETRKVAREMLPSKSGG